jgi:hypothetical protein
VLATEQIPDDGERESSRGANYIANQREEASAPLARS